MVEITKSGAYVLSKVLDNLRHDTMSLGQMRMSIRISTLITQNAAMKKFIEAVEGLEDLGKREAYAEKNGPTSVKINEIATAEIAFVRTNWKMIRTAFAKQLDKRVIVDIADAFKVADDASEEVDVEAED